MTSNRNQGFSTRLKYDNCYIRDDTAQSTEPLSYWLDPNQINNCGACLSTLGPRIGYMGYGDSTTVGHVNAPSQALVDVESILQNRNMLISKCKDGQTNNIDVFKFPVKNARICDNKLNPQATHLSNPPYNFREIQMNRFETLPQNPQLNIFQPFAVNTQLEAKDNYVPKCPKPLNQKNVYPKTYNGSNSGNFCK